MPAIAREGTPSAAIIRVSGSGGGGTGTGKYESTS